ncbi:response regulator transcription factor [soil metagenome]
MPNILLVEDDESLRLEIKRAIEHEGHSVTSAGDLSGARHALQGQHFDLIVLDWGLPDGSGVEYCRLLRQSGEKASILILTGKSLPAEKVEGLESGADDYLTKPFNLKELTLRVRSLIKRGQRPLNLNVMEARGLTLDAGTQTATRYGATIELTQKEFDLLEYLLRNRSRVHSLEDLLSHVWVAEEDAAPDTVRTHIRNLRKKLDKTDEHSLIENVHGFGYKIADEG